MVEDRSSFEDQIDKTDTLKPTGRAFDPASFEAAFAAFAEGSEPSVRDRQLYDFGLWTASSLAKVYSHAAKCGFAKLHPAEQVMALAGLAMHQIRAIGEEAHVAASGGAGTNGGRAILAREAPHVLGAGLVLQCLEVIEGRIDIVQHALQTAMLKLSQSRISRAARPPLSFAQELGDLHEFLRCASVARTLNEFWERVLAGRYRAVRSADGRTWTIDRPEAEAMREAVGQGRRYIQDEFDRNSFLQKEAEDIASILAECRIAISRVQPSGFAWAEDRWSFELAPAPPLGDALDAWRLEAWLIRSSVHTWLAGLADRPMRGLARPLTGRHLLAGWLALRRLASAFVSKRKNADPEHPSWQCPIFARAELVDYLCRGHDWDRLRASIVLDRLTHDGSLDRELFGHPVISLDRDRDMLFLPGFLYAHPERVLDLHLSAGLHKDVYKEKGPLYEAYLRGMLSLATQSALLPGAWRVRETSLRFDQNRQGAKAREFDVLIAIGRTLIVGEVKCGRHPSEPREAGERERRIARAARQVREQVDWIRENWSAFRQRAMLGLSSDIADHTILPVVILDGCYGPGFEVDGIPILDGVELIQYMIANRVPTRQDLGTGRQFDPIILYDDAASAEENLFAYLRKPPRVVLLEAECKSRTLAYQMPHFIDSTISYHDYVLPALIGAQSERDEATGEVKG